MIWSSRRMVYVRSISTHPTHAVLRDPRPILLLSLLYRPFGLCSCPGSATRSHSQFHTRLPFVRERIMRPMNMACHGSPGSVSNERKIHHLTKIRLEILIRAWLVRLCATSLRETLPQHLVITNRMDGSTKSGTGVEFLPEGRIAAQGIVNGDAELLAKNSLNMNSRSFCRYHGILTARSRGVYAIFIRDAVLFHI